MSMSVSPFYERIAGELTSSLGNNYRDNFDHLRFNDRPPPTSGASLREFCKATMRKRGILAKRWVDGIVGKAVCNLGPYLPRLSALYDRLEDDQSRDLLVKVLAFRCLGNRHVRLPLSTPDYWEAIDNIAQLADSNDVVDPHFHDWKLQRIDLESVGLPCRIYATPKHAYTQMVLQQYRCHTDHAADICVNSGDVVIDCGGCWGDTAVYFSHLAGDNGQVYTFEFIPSNLEILEKNLALNPQQAERVNVVKNAVWDTSDLSVTYRDHGPGSSVSIGTPAGSDTSRTDVTTLTIDDLVERRNLSSVDFIKMDIEGAEMPALRGAAQTIKRFRPTLAIAVYHSLADFVDVPEFITSTADNYELYLRHFTIHSEETVLFAHPR